MTRSKDIFLEQQQLDSINEQIVFHEQAISCLKGKRDAIRTTQKVGQNAVDQFSMIYENDCYDIYMQKINEAYAADKAAELLTSKIDM